MNAPEFVLRAVRDASRAIHGNLVYEGVSNEKAAELIAEVLVQFGGDLKEYLKTKKSDKWPHARKSSLVEVMEET